MFFEFFYIYFNYKYQIDFKVHTTVATDVAHMNACRHMAICAYDTRRMCGARMACD